MAAQAETNAPPAPQVGDAVAALEAFIADKDRARAAHRLAYLFWECTLRCNL